VSETAPEAAADPTVAEAAAESTEKPSHPQFIPVFKDPEPEAVQDYAFMPTAAPPVTDVEIQREPALQETAEETTRSTRADRVEPGLLSTIGQQVHSFDDAPVHESVAAPQPQVNSQSTAEAFAVSSSSAPAAPDSMTDADFEARVAAAMAAYSSAETVAEPSAAVEPELAAEEHSASPAATDAYEAPETQTSEATHARNAGIPAFEYQPPVRPGAIPAEAAQVETNSTAAESSSVAESVSAEVETAVPEAAAAAVAADTATDHHTIAQAVHRVMERLKPELVEEIMRELRSKK
jgi:hypothetical protein